VRQSRQEERQEESVTAGAALDPDWLIACDLDQTLIYSERAFRLPEGAAAPDLVIAEYLDGAPLSYLTRTAARELRALASRVLVMPVTTRTLAQYARVNLGFAPAYAIAANGGHLLVDGVADPDWADGVRVRLAASGLSLEAVRERAERLASGAAGRWVRTIRDADELFVYLVATGRAAIPDLSHLAAELSAGGWTLSVQGRKVYLVPAALTKEAAIVEVLRRTGRHRLAAAGDSLLDAGMLALAESGVRPAHGELHDQGVPLDGIAVTAQAGLLGGEAVVSHLAAMVLAPVTRTGVCSDAGVTFRVPAG
jgi:hydroxymethylpyrimidine pyrophosphatase-like HAD family hydrolase